MSAGVYGIRNSVTGDIYIGSTARSINQRWGSHKRDLGRGSHANQRLQRAWNKHGVVVFSFDVLEICDASQCLSREQWYIDKEVAVGRRDGLYNMCLVAGSALGRRHRPEVRARLAEHLRVISRANIGRRASAETRVKMSLAQRGKKQPRDAVARTAAALRGRKHTPEMCAKNSAAHMGRRNSLDAIAKTAAALRGRKRPSDVVAKITARNRTPDVRRKLSEAAKKQWAEGRGWKGSNEGLITRDTAAAMLAQRWSLEVRERSPSPRGENVKTAKLTESQVREMRAIYGRNGNGGLTQTQLANRYAIDQGHVSAILRKKAWAHV